MCSTPHLYEDEIKLRFITVFAEFFQKKDVVLETCHMLMEELADTSAHDSKIEQLLMELNDISQRIREHIQKNASEVQNQEEYSIQYSNLEKQFQRKTKAINQEKKKQTKKTKTKKHNSSNDEKKNQNSKKKPLFFFLLKSNSDVTKSRHRDVSHHSFLLFFVV